jgi:uncharacterized protein (TIGR03000 family)
VVVAAPAPARAAATTSSPAYSQAPADTDRYLAAATRSQPDRYQAHLASGRILPRPSASAPAEQVAHITVKVPAAAQLFVNDQPCPLTSDTRSFDTPRLEPGRDYAYTLRAELVRNGQKLSETRQVVFRAGRSVMVDFGDLAPAGIARR